MKYRIEISSVAEAETDGAFLNLSVQIIHIRYSLQQSISENSEESDRG
jgi:hypothetical protein